MFRPALVSLAGALGAATLLLPATTATAEPPSRDTATRTAAPSLDGMRVLLTNDDSVQGRDTAYGTDGKGLYELRRALCAAGADVVVVAPWSQQSGAGAKVTTPGGHPVAISVAEASPPAPYAGDCGNAPSGAPVYGVCVADGGCVAGSPSASPSDAVLVGLARVVPDHYWAAGPDVVVSGVNFGQNVGELVNHSGTVGAAITAQEQGVPAVAVSAEASFEDLAGTPLRAAAEFAVATLDRLERTRALGRIGALNVNYPFLGAGESLGRPTVATVGEATDIAFSYTGEAGAEGGTYQLVVGEPTAETRRRADTTALRGNDIPLTLLDGDWTAPLGSGGYLRLLAALRR